LQELVRHMLRNRIQLIIDQEDNQD
jgi:hypothetical protein